MDIYLIRHGQSIANRFRIMQGWLDSPLSNHGRIQAQKLQHELPNRYDGVYSSPLLRAKETAMISLGIAENNAKLEIINDLKEIGVGNVEGKPFSEIGVSEKERRDWVNLEHDSFKDRFNSEPIEDFIKRTSAAFDQIIKNAHLKSQRRILIFSHGGTMRAIVGRKLKLIQPEDMRIVNTEIIRIKFEGSVWKLVSRKREHVLLKLIN